MRTGFPVCGSFKPALQTLSFRTKSATCRAITPIGIYWCIAGFTARPPSFYVTYLIGIILIAIVVVVEILITFPVLIWVPCAAIQIASYGAFRTAVSKTASHYGFLFLSPWQGGIREPVTHECLYLVARQYVALVNRSAEIQLVHINAAGKSHVGLALREHSLIQVDPD